MTGLKKFEEISKYAKYDHLFKPKKTAKILRTFEESKACESIITELIGPTGRKKYACKEKPGEYSKANRVWVRHTCVKCKKFRNKHPIVNLKPLFKKRELRHFF